MHLAVVTIYQKNRTFISHQRGYHHDNPTFLTFSHVLRNSAICTLHVLRVVVQTYKMVVLCPDLAVAWEASALFDVFISVLTFTRTLKMRKTHNMANSSIAGLLDLILRDGK